MGPKGPAAECSLDPKVNWSPSTRLNREESMTRCLKSQNIGPRGKVLEVGRKFSHAENWGFGLKQVKVKVAQSCLTLRDPMD